MAFDPKPSTWLGAGYSLAASQAKINTSTNGGTVAAPELTDAEADPTTGDVRKLFFAIVQMMYAAYQAQSAADRPVQMVLGKNSVVNNADSTIQHNFTFTFTNAITAQDVAPEP